MYTTEEKVQMCLWYQNNSLRKVADLFAVEYPDRPIPSISTIFKIVKKFKNDGCVANHNKRFRDKTVLTEDMRLNILCYVEEQPFQSLKEVASVFEISASSIRNALKIEKYKSYKVRNHQQLLIDDGINRTNFCELMFDMLNNDANLLQKICFTDEATFTMNGTVNSQNYRFLQFI